MKNHKKNKITQTKSYTQTFPCFLPQDKEEEGDGGRREPTLIKD